MPTPWDVLAAQGQLPVAPEGLSEEELAQLGNVSVAPPQVQGAQSPVTALKTAEKAALDQQRQGINLYEQNINKIMSQGQGGFDFTPLAAFSDSLFGTKLTQAAMASKPMTQAQRMQMVTKLQDELQRRRGDYSKAELDALKTQIMFQLGSEKNAKEKEPTADQSKAALFGKRMAQAEDVFGDLTGQGFDPTTQAAAAERTLVPGILQSGVTKQQSQAEENFLNAVLRRESGAAIGKDEFTKGESQYFPRGGDTPEVVAQKLANRQLAVEGMKAEAGHAWDKIKTPKTVNQAAKERLAELRQKYGK